MVTRSLCLLFLLALSASAQTPRIPPPESVNRNGLVGQWLGNGWQSPTLALDSTKATHGSFSNSPSWAMFGGRAALSFAGTNSIFIPPSISHGGFSNAMTVAVWVRTGNPNQNFGSMIAKMTVTSVDNWWLAFNGTTGNPRFFVNVLGEGVRSATSSAGVPTNKWTHIVGVVDRGNCFIYTESALAGSQFVGAPGVFSNSSAVAVNVGRRFDGYHFTGQLYDLRIYNRALSAAEIKRIYRGIQ
jgi:hypothetical protein